MYMVEIIRCGRECVLYKESGIPTATFTKHNLGAFFIPGNLSAVDILIFFKLGTYRNHPVNSGISGVLNGKVRAEDSPVIREEMFEVYPNLKQAYHSNDGMYLVIYRLLIDEISIA